MSDRTRTAVLGIDAAWTEKEPSGVALIEESGGAWRFVTVASSYGLFLGQTNEPDGHWPGADALLGVARRRLVDRTLSVVAIDMPLALVPITKRRGADDAVSRKFGAAKCSTHTPSATRPGQLADRMRREFEVAGYALATAETQVGMTGQLLEVYPHPALLSLCGRTERLRYKVGKRRRYWRQETPAERLELLFAEWEFILVALRERIADIDLALPEDTSSRALKGFEDRLDALVSAWVGAEYLSGRARPYGDATAAIWVPERAKDVESSKARAR